MGEASGWQSCVARCKSYTIAIQNLFGNSRKQGGKLNLSLCLSAQPQLEYCLDTLTSNRKLTDIFTGFCQSLH
jgi:hypothetical protein